MWVKPRATSKTGGQQARQSPSICSPPKSPATDLPLHPHARNPEFLIALAGCALEGEKSLGSPSGETVKLESCCEPRVRLDGARGLCEEKKKALLVVVGDGNAKQSGRRTGQPWGEVFYIPPGAHLRRPGPGGGRIVFGAFPVGRGSVRTLHGRYFVHYVVHQGCQGAGGRYRDTVDAFGWHGAAFGRRVS